MAISLGVPKKTPCKKQTIFVNGKPRYNWTPQKIQLVKQTVTGFYNRNLKDNSYGLELEDVIQDILYKLISVSGYKTNSMNLYKDDAKSLRGFVYKVCGNYVADKNDFYNRRLKSKFTVGYFDDIFPEDTSYNAEDMIAGVPQNQDIIKELYDKTPDLPIARTTSLTFKKLFELLLDVDITEVASNHHISLKDLKKGKKDLVCYLRGFYDTF